MTDARDDVLRTIRRSLGVTGREAPRQAVVTGRLASAPRGIVPARGEGSVEQRTETFKRYAEMAHTTVVVLASRTAVPAEVAGFLRSINAPAAIRVGQDPRLLDLPWSETALDVSSGRSHGADLNAVSFAFGAVAESGTVVLASGEANPTTLNFLPDNHIVVLSADEIAGDLETVMDRLGERFGPTAMPRTLNLVTGPSRSGDIEQTLILGAHGPRRLHVIVVPPDGVPATADGYRPG